MLKPLLARKTRNSIPKLSDASGPRNRYSGYRSAKVADPEPGIGRLRVSGGGDLLSRTARGGDDMAQLDDAGSSGATSTAVTDAFPTHNVGKPEVREMPAEPKKYLPLIGPGIIAAGVGLASGEFILFPYIASQVGLVFVWAALVGLGTQFFLNMEIERYTLATGETALTGFSRLWKHWGLVFAILTYFANLWPGWATSSATLVTYIFGGNVTAIAIAILLLCRGVLPLAPVVYTGLERVIVVKLGILAIFAVIAVIFAVTGDAW